MGQHRVRSIEAIIVDLPLRRVQRFAAIGAKETAVVLIRVTTSSGITGIGECCTPSGPWWGGESVESIKLMIDQYISPHVVGEDVFDIRGIFQSVDRKLYGNFFAKAGVEMALVDLQGKIAGVAVCDLLGGKRRRSLPCSWPLATGETSAEIDEAHDWIDRKAFNSFKLKMGFLDPETDVARACEISRALEGEATVRVDPNESWDETTCKWALPRMADAGIQLVEQPMPRWNVAASKRLTASSPIPVMLDESVSTLQDVLQVGHQHAADAVSLKVMKHGGIIASRKIADVAIASGLSLYMGTFLECSIGTAASMQLAASLERLPYGGELSGPNLVSDDIAVEAARYENFELQLNDGVGLAVEVDDDKVNALRRDRSYSVHSMPKARLKSGDDYPINQRED